MCSELRAEMDDIEQNGLLFFDQESKTTTKYNITFHGFGDMKFTRMLLGLGSVASTYCCEWCGVTQEELSASLQSTKWYCHLYYLFIIGLFVYLFVYYLFIIYLFIYLFVC
jgi:hypothetical protein